MRDRTTSWLVAALCGACGMAVGLWLAPSRTGTLAIPPLTVEAMASAEHDDFVIATGFMEDDIEGLFFLDFVTGDLKATVPDRRGRGFNALYRYNIAGDFQLGAAKPKFLMVTGDARALQRGGVGGGSLARSVVYVVEATTGQVVVYGIPYNRSAQSAGKTQVGTFVPLARAGLRGETVREQ